jgi:citrate lyase subunit beta/citryl-CoA lyase
MKPLRTALFAPGNRPDRAAKAIGLNADAVIIDLEDAVPIAEKESSRSMVREVLDAHPGKRIFVRVNALSTPYAGEDLAAVVCNNLSGIVLPKVESPEDVLELDRLLTPFEEKAGRKGGSLEVIAICESAKGLEQIFPIAAARPAHHPVSTVAFGSADYALDLGITLTREGKEIEYPRSRIPVACRAAGIMPPLDTPWMIDLKDIDGLIADAKRAKACGFQGKILIHPNQIEPCHEVFTPTAEEVEYARQVIAAFEQAEREGRAAIQLEGKFIDYPVVEKARRICTLIDAIEGKN